MILRNRSTNFGSWCGSTAASSTNATGLRPPGTPCKSGSAALPGPHMVAKRRLERRQHVLEAHLALQTRNQVRRFCFDLISRLAAELNQQQRLRPADDEVQIVAI